MSCHVVSCCVISCQVISIHILTCHVVICVLWDILLVSSGSQCSMPCCAAKPPSSHFRSCFFLLVLHKQCLALTASIPAMLCSCSCGRSGLCLLPLCCAALRCAVLRCAALCCAVLISAMLLSTAVAAAEGWQEVVQAETAVLQQLARYYPTGGTAPSSIVCTRLGLHGSSACTCSWVMHACTVQGMLLINQPLGGYGSA